MRRLFLARAICCSAPALALVLAGCAASQPPVRLAPEAVSQVKEACRDLAAVDLGRIPKGMPDFSRFEEFHRLARGGAYTPEQRSTAHLKLAIPGGGFQMPYGLSVWAARQPDGVWRVSHVRYLQLPPPPPPPGVEPPPAPPQLVVTTGTLKPEAAQRIEAALASDCLKREPFRNPGILPMKNRQDLLCPPDAGGGNALEITEGSRVRRYLHECARKWASGTIIIALENSENLLRD